jgi:DNA polymerase III subunit delta
MPVYYFWGEDDFALRQAIDHLRAKVLDPAWASFNYERIAPEEAEAIIQGLNQAMTPPFGAGQRLIWLAETTLASQCDESTLQELERTLPQIPDTSVLLLSSTKQPNGRLKIAKLLQKYAEFREFSPLPPWRTDALEQQVAQTAEQLGVRLTQEATETLAQAVGNQTRRLYNELEKLRLFQGDRPEPLSALEVTSLVPTSTQNSLQLAAAIRVGDAEQALHLIGDLIARNEPPLRIVATLVGQFRTWLWVKLLASQGERDNTAIAQAAEIGNPKRVYFVQQEVRNLSLAQLQQTLPLLLELEYGLKLGADEQALLQTKAIELCQVCRSQV